MRKMFRKVKTMSTELSLYLNLPAFCYWWFVPKQ